MRKSTRALVVALTLGALVAGLAGSEWLATREARATCAELRRLPDALECTLHHGWGGRRIVLVVRDAPARERLSELLQPTIAGCRLEVVADHEGETPAPVALLSEVWPDLIALANPVAVSWEERHNHDFESRFIVHAPKQAAHLAALCREQVGTIRLVFDDDVDIPQAW